MGVYRLWRDLGFAVGAVLSGALADAVDIKFAIVVVAAITAASGADVTVRSNGCSIPSSTYPPS